MNAAIGSLIRNGKTVHTSEVQAIAETAGVKYIITRNSIYKVEGEII